tara:strand:+ start:24982 stop:25452 length:471 start_codon:yes stop_codon:yes gene_type:complete
VKRLIILSILISFCSCDYFSFKKNPNQEKIDTIVNIKEVDVSPSFKICDSIIEKTQKTACFRNTIHREIAKSLANQKIKVRRTVNETITVTITIQANSKMVLKSVDASEDLYKEIPKLKAYLEKSIEELPKIFPAIKRSIPVTSEYKLPILIKLKK